MSDLIHGRTTTRQTDSVKAAMSEVTRLLRLLASEPLSEDVCKAIRGGAYLLERLIEGGYSEGQAAELLRLLCNE